LIAVDVVLPFMKPLRAFCRCPIIWLSDGLM
jgi:hypothetical protein